MVIGPQPQVQRTKKKTINGYWLIDLLNWIIPKAALFICCHTINFRNLRLIYTLFQLTSPTSLSEFQIAGNISVSRSPEPDPRNHWTIHHQTWMAMVMHICNYSWMRPPFTTALCLGVFCQWNCGTHCPTSSRHGSATTLVEP